MRLISLEAQVSFQLFFLALQTLHTQVMIKSCHIIWSHLIGTPVHLPACAFIHDVECRKHGWEVSGECPDQSESMVTRSTTLYNVVSREACGIAETHTRFLFQLNHQFNHSEMLLPFITFVKGDYFSYFQLKLVWDQQSCWWHRDNLI